MLQFSISFGMFNAIILGYRFEQFMWNIFRCNKPIQVCTNMHCLLSDVCVHFHGADSSAASSRFCKQHIGYDELAFKYYIKDVAAASKWILSIEYHLKVCYEIKINLPAFTLPDVLFVD